MHLHVDFDAFYCGVEQNLNPSLRDKPFIIAQKNCAATTSYAARKLGIKKLTRVSDVKNQFPDVLIINGEDLTRYKAEGQRIFEFLRDDVLPGSLVERVGMEEVKINLDRLVDCALAKLAKIGISSVEHIQTLVEDEDFEELIGNGLDLPLTPDDSAYFQCPDFFFKHAGCVAMPNSSVSSLQLYVASHIAHYVKERLFMEHHYSVSIGCSDNLMVSKVISGENKPFGLTILEKDDFQDYLDKLHIRKVPGYGSKMVQTLDNALKSDYDDLTVKYVRENMPLKGGPVSFYALFSPKLGQRLWNLIHALPVETDAETEHAKEYPQSISVEDTHGNLVKYPIKQVLEMLCERLIQQLTNSLYDSTNCSWKALPHTLHLSIRQEGDGYPQRRSKSTAFPALPMSSKSLVHQLGPLYRQLYKPKRAIHVLNIAAARIKEQDDLL